MQRALYIMDHNFIRLKVLNNYKLMDDSCSEDVFKFSDNFTWKEISCHRKK